ncbi:MAG: T9SS type A sorting domain-containing protein [Flavobacteriales bacterium]
MKQVFTFLTAFSVFYANAQTSTRTQTFSYERKSVVIPMQSGPDYAPELQCIEKPVPGGLSEKQGVYKTTHESNGQRAQSTTLPPIVRGKHFYGNSFASATPNDNDMAISNGGKIISVINSTLFFYDTNGDSTLGFQSYSNFTTSLGLIHDEFDPKVIYDPVEDRFITAVLNGFTDTTSDIILGFSQTNDPLGAWNLYTLPGNPLNNGLWTDYPMFALTDKELFVTVNLLYPDSSWQTGFVETIIWQLKKMDGFTGQALTSALHTNIEFNNRPIRNLCPTRGGSTIYGPDMYFVSNRNFQTQSDTFFLVRTTDTIGASGFAIEIKQMNANADYFLAGEARQSGTHMFATNDSRILGAFYENNQIQFAQNCLDTTTGFTAVYHGIVTNLGAANPTVTGQVVSDTLLDLGYPNIAYAGLNASDNSAVIGFDHTAPTVNAGCSAIKTDGNGNYTPILKIIDGTSYVNVLSGTERWGDYLGIQTRYNNPGEVWMAGYFGYQSGFQRLHRAYIGQIFADSIDFSSTPENTIPEFSNLGLYPNPAENLVTVDFYLSKAHYLSFTIYDLQGRVISTLMREWVRPGKNQFTFQAGDMAPGTYILRITHQGEIMATKKFVRK